MTHDFTPLIEAEELVLRLEEKEVVILDATFTLPSQNRCPQAEFEKVHLPGAQFFNIDVIAAPDCGLPHMLPASAEFEAAVSNLGIGNKTEVVVYDNNLFMASARVWWMFRTFGHEKVRVLNGGFQRWTSLDYPSSSSVKNPVPKLFSASFNAERVRNFASMQMISADSSSVILDARPLGRFLGQEPEPRPGLRSGHIPGSRSLFFQRLLDSQTGCLLKKSDLIRVFDEVRVSPKDPIVATCGSGVTAAIIALALAELGYPNTPLYDGSWAEWGQPGDHMVASGDPA